MKLEDTPEPEVLPSSEVIEGSEVHEPRQRPKHLRDRAFFEKKKAKIISLAVQKVPEAQIARALEMPKSTVQDIIKKFKPVFDAIERVQDFREVRADILAASQITALESALDAKKLKKSSFLATVTGVEKLHKMERLENDQSTSNAAIVFGGIGLNVTKE